MSEKGKGAKPNQPQPREDFGHPALSHPKHTSSDHKPGDDAAAPPSAADAAVMERNAAVVPPYGASQTPKTSLAERIKQQLNEKE